MTTQNNTIHYITLYNQYLPVNHSMPLPLLAQSSVQYVQSRSLPIPIGIRSNIYAPLRPLTSFRIENPVPQGKSEHFLTVNIL